MVRSKNKNGFWLQEFSHESIRSFSRVPYKMSATRSSSLNKPNPDAEQDVEPNGSSGGSSFLDLVVTSLLFAVGSLGRSLRKI